MKNQLSSRERMLCTMRRQTADHVPLWNLWRNQDIPFVYHDQTERAEAVLDLGLDDTLLLQPPLNKTEHYDVNRAPGAKIRVSRVTSEGEWYPLLAKEYATPAGPLRQVIRLTEDWPYGEDIRLFSDFNVSRAKEFPVKDLQDLPRLRHLLCEPTGDQVQTFRQEAARLRKTAQHLGVVLEGGWTALGDAALWLLGTQALLYSQMDRPEFVEELLELVCQWEIRRMELLLEEGVDVIVHSAWYESADFWSPKNYRRMLKPRLQRMVARAHQAGVLFSYIITTSWQPLVDDLIEIGFDSLVGVDPLQGKANLAMVKRQLGGKLCLWGGINGAITLGNGSPGQVRQATRTAIEILAPGGGFVLYPVDQLVKETPWTNVQAMIETWREIGSYQ